MTFRGFQDLCNYILQSQSFENVCIKHFSLLLIFKDNMSAHLEQLLSFNSSVGFCDPVPAGRNLGADPGEPHRRFKGVLHSGLFVALRLG